MPGAMAQTWLPIPRNEDYVGNWPAAAPRPGVSLCYTSCKFIRADVAQLVEQPIRNRQVIGSSPIVGSSFSSTCGSVHRDLLHICCTSNFCFQPLHRLGHHA